MKAPKVRAILLNENKTTGIATVNIVVYVYDLLNKKGIVYFPTGIRVPKKNFTNGKVSRLKNSDEINTQIEAEKTKISKLLLQMETKGIAINKLNLEATKQTNKYSNKPLIDLIKFVYNYKIENNKIVNTNVYESLIFNLKEYETKNKIVLGVSHITQNFINDLIKFFTAKGLQPSTKENYLVHLKTSFKELYKKNIINDDFNKLDYSVKTYESDLPTLNKDEISILLNTKLKLHYDEIVRKKFLIQLFTGLRYSDLDQISKENIVDGYVLVYTKKNKAPLEIPINPIILPILEEIKFDVKNQLHIEINYFNQVIKRVFKKLKLNRSVQTIQEKENLVITKNRPLNEVISSHVARRTAITLFAEMGKTTNQIKSITGHKDSNSVDRYVKISKEHKKKIMDDLNDYLAI